MRHVFRRSKRILRRMKAMTSLYRWLFFTLIFCARCLRNLSASPPIPPVVLNTSGVKEAFSTCSTLELYLSFFSRSWVKYICGMLLFLLDGACGCSTLTSRNVLSNGVQKLLALISSLAPSTVVVQSNSCYLLGENMIHTKLWEIELDDISMDFGRGTPLILWGYRR